MSGLDGPPSAGHRRLQIRQHLDYLRCLPADRRFRKDEINDDLPVRRLRNIGAVKTVDEVEVEYETEGGHHTKQRNVYEFALTREAREVLEADEDGDKRYTPCPCGHSGLENHGDHFQCGFDLCGQKFDRDELGVDG